MIPVLRRTERGYHVHFTEEGLNVGIIERGPNMTRPTGEWGYTLGFGWHTGLPTVGAALDALLADPRLGVDL